MNIIVDTREQLPLPFKCGTMRLCLPFGDYGCELKDGTMVNLVFERKSIADLYGTLSKGYERFRKMLRKAEAEDVKVCIIIEGSLRKVAKGFARSQRSGGSIIKQLFTLRAVYNVEIVFCQDRMEMAAHIEHCFDAYRRIKV